jgi:hypothetical protein
MALLTPAGPAKVVPNLEFARDWFAKGPARFSGNGECRKMKSGE